MDFLKKVLKALILVIFGFVLIAVISNAYKDYKAKEAWANMPSLPVVYKLIPSLMGRGDVIIIESRHNRDLPVQLAFKNEDGTKHKIINIVLKPKAKKMIGWLEGWRLEKGDTLMASSKGFKNVAYDHAEKLEKIPPELVCGAFSLIGLPVLCGFQEN